MLLNHHLMPIRWKLLLSIAMPILALTIWMMRSHRTIDAYRQLPMSFEVNRGQFSDEFNFSSRGPGYFAFFKATGAVLKLQNGNALGMPRTKTLRLELLGADAN